MRPIIVLSFVVGFAVGACDKTDDGEPAPYTACGDERSEDGCCVTNFGGGENCFCNQHLDCDGDMWCVATDVARCVPKDQADAILVYCAPS